MLIQLTVDTHSGKPHGLRLEYITTALILRLFQPANVVTKMNYPLDHINHYKPWSKQRYSPLLPPLHSHLYLFFAYYSDC